MRAALVVWILSAVVCLGRGQHPEGHVAAQDTAADSNSVSLVTAGNKQFAFRLYRHLAAHAESQGKNIFYSPASVSLALAALAVGAGGETHRQLFSGLGFNATQLTQADVDRAFRTLLDGKASQESTSEGTAVFMDNDFRPHPGFLQVLKQSYLADGFSIDFAKTAESAEVINRYVAEKTNGKIDKLVEDLDASTIMYLVSYIYFKGKWETPFNPDLTREAMFTVDENTQVPVQMMYREASFDTYYDMAINTSVLRIPFNSSHTMMLLLPDNMETLENAICPAHMTKWQRWMRSRTHKVFIPKFSIKTSYSMKDVLAQMGMTDMFRSNADLSGISDATNMVVSEVVHKATLDVDETGATAAAATGVRITLMSLRIVPVLRFDRPFMVVITENTSDNILFMGKIVNPNI